MIMLTTDEMLDALTSDGDTFDLDDERTLRLRIRPDEDARPFEEYDCYGRVAYVDDRWHRTRDPRPSDMDGNAEKISDGRNTWWWQPPADVKRADPGFVDFRNHVKDVLAYGMVGVVVELTEGHDAYGRAIVRDVASLWGIEPFPTTGYLREVISNLVAELKEDEG